MMWGLVAVAVLFGALSLAAWKLCFSQQPCKTRSAAPRLTGRHSKIDTPFPHN
jgi:hypothetical protein